jgi:von Willebrand factor type A domain
MANFFKRIIKNKRKNDPISAIITSDTSETSKYASTVLQTNLSSNLLLSSDPPPAYSPPQIPPTVNTNALSLDDRYSFLRSFDTVFLIDDSGSMVGKSWRQTKLALAAITPICTSYDSDGIDIYFLNKKDTPIFRNVKNITTVNQIFTNVRPSGSTPTGNRLRHILKPYLDRYSANPESTKPLNIIVITDGEPSDDVESTIIWAADRLDKKDAPAWQVGIQFFQVGNEPGAREHLEQLDDYLGEISGNKELRDIVDTVPWTSANGGVLNSDGILKVRNFLLPRAP